MKTLTRRALDGVSSGAFVEAGYGCRYAVKPADQLGIRPNNQEREDK